MKKRERAKFLRLACEFIESIGGVHTNESDIYEYILPTAYGSLRLHVDENATDGPGTVFCRFHNPALVPAALDANPYSGKWNHHYFEGWTVEQAITDLKYRLLPLVVEHLINCGA